MQLERYASVLRELSSEPRKIMLGLYYPLVPRLLHWISAETSTVVAGTSNLMCQCYPYYRTYPEDRQGHMSQPRRLVLCVDDERVGLHVRKLLLERSGYQVITAHDGKTPGFRSSRKIQLTL